MEELKNLLKLTPQEFEAKCNEMAERVKERKNYWLGVFKQMELEDYKKLVCNQSEGFHCCYFSNEKYFLGYTDEKPEIKILENDFSFGMECPFWDADNFCFLKKKVEKEKNNMKDIIEEEDF